MEGTIYRIRREGGNRPCLSRGVAVLAGPTGRIKIRMKIKIRKRSKSRITIKSKIDVMSGWDLS